MIKEDYCSEEVSKLLQEKGFKEPCTGLDKLLCKEGEKPLLLITHQKAMKWLRDEKNILLYVYPVIVLPVKNNYTFYWRWEGKKKRHDVPHIGDKHNYESFEEAVEAALKCTLEKLI